MRIRIKAGSLVMDAELNDSPTAQALAAALPIKGSANCWGDEIYFRIPVKDEALPDARTEMAVGELAYWPPGQAFCIFFGPTPASTDDRPQAASPANPLGRVLGDAVRFSRGRRRYAGSARDKRRPIDALAANQPGDIQSERSRASLVCVKAWLCLFHLGACQFCSITRACSSSKRNCERSGNPAGSELGELSQATYGRHVHRKGESCVT